MKLQAFETFVGVICTGLTALLVLGQDANAISIDQAISHTQNPRELGLALLGFYIGTKLFRPSNREI
jgi:hypothetical protein